MPDGQTPGDRVTGAAGRTGPRSRRPVAVVPLLLVLAVVVAAATWFLSRPGDDEPSSGASTEQSEANDGSPGRDPSTPPGAAVAVAENPFAGVELAVDTDSAAADALDRESDPERARLLRKVASQPVAEWFGDWVEVDELASEVRGTVGRAAVQDALPLLVAYNVPERDCGGWSSGGAAGPQQYREWVDAFAAGIGDAQAVVVLEPDALAAVDCLDEAQRETRYELLAYAVDRLAALPGAAVYVDAGHSDWVPADDMADRLERVGVDKARGFALNVANFGPTATEVAYGRDITQRLGGTPFVVDTSRNGLGRGSGQNRWCNPPGRALGEPPLSPPPDPAVDALLWIKTPGQSDGECDRGQPPAGTFWPDYAIGLAARATW